MIAFHDKVAAAANVLEKRKANLEEHAEAMKEWKTLDDTHKTENVKIWVQWKVDVGLWETERDLTKSEKWRAHWNKPILKGLLFSPIWKLQLSRKKEIDPSDSSNDSDSDGSDSSSDSA